MGSLCMAALLMSLWPAMEYRLNSRVRSKAWMND